MNELSKQENMTKALATMEFKPVLVQEELKLAEYTKLPLSRVTALGTAFEPLKTAIESSNVVPGSGLYKVTVPPGTHLASFRNGSGNLGTVLSDSSNQISGQATLNPISLDPTMLFMASTLASIDKKLDTIQETQKEMFDYIQQKDKSELKGNMIFLADILENYKYNWNNDLYKSSNHVKVLDIRQVSEQSIDFFKEQIGNKIRKKSFINTDQDINKQIESIQSDFKEYQLALYIYSYAAFLEVMLLENYNSDYLNGISKRIRDYSLEYKELYTQCYNELEGKSGSSVQSYMLKGASKASKFVGKTAEKIPGINNTKINENLLEASDKISDFDSKRTEKRLHTLTSYSANVVVPFADSVDKVNMLYNNELSIAFDGENLYLQG